MCHPCAIFLHPHANKKGVQFFSTPRIFIYHLPFLYVYMYKNLSCFNHPVFWNKLAYHGPHTINITGRCKKITVWVTYHYEEEWRGGGWSTATLTSDEGEQQENVEKEEPASPAPRARAHPRPARSLVRPDQWEDSAQSHTPSLGRKGGEVRW